MEQNKLFHERYFLSKLLGRGNFSEVWLARDTLTDIEVALKIYAPATGLDDAGLNVFAREFSLVVNANHKNLLKPLYYDSFERKPYLVLPFCRQGSIQRLIGKFTEEDAWRLLRDVASGLAWLHGMNPPVIHQDIKPDNVMVGDNGNFMITDFGVSTHLRSSLRKSMSSAFSSAGTIAYMAPERFSKDNTPIMANDIYSLGSTAYEMLTGDTPFGDDGGLVHKKGAELPELEGNYSEQLKKTIMKCLALNPWERPTAEQLEQYAITALNGQTIRFVDEKTVWQKFKWAIIAACVVVVAGAAIGGFVINKNAKERARQAEMLRIENLNNSILENINALEASADSISNIGDEHDEGYESAYLKAFSYYSEALGLVEKFEGDFTYNTEGISNKVNIVENKLYEAYQNFMNKAERFSDDVEVSREFEDRASKISSVIDIHKYQIKEELHMIDPELTGLEGDSNELTPEEKIK